MRVLYLIQYFTTPDQSGSARAYDLVRYLVDRGHEVTVITGNVHYHARTSTTAGWKLFSQDGRGRLRVVRIGWLLPYGQRMAFRWLNYLSFAVTATLAGTLYGGPADAVVASSTPLTIGIPGLILAWWKRAPFVFEVRDLWPAWLLEFGLLKPGLATCLAARLESLCYRRAARVITVTRGMREELVERGVPARKIVHIFQGADVSLCRPGSRQNAFSKAQALDGRFVCLYTGNQGKVAGLEYVLSAAKMLRKERDILFLLIGEGTNRPVLEAMAADLGLENVRFLDAVPKRMIPEVIAAGDLCINSVRNVSCAHRFMPSKVFDYAACGRPILSNIAGESAEWLTVYEAGIATDPTDPASMAAAVTALRDDPELRRRMGDNARRLAEDILDRRFAAAAFEELLLEVVG